MLKVPSMQLITPSCFLVCLCIFLNLTHSHWGDVTLTSGCFRVSSHQTCLWKFCQWWLASVLYIFHSTPAVLKNASATCAYCCHYFFIRTHKNEVHTPKKSIKVTHWHFSHAGNLEKVLYLAFPFHSYIVMLTTCHGLSIQTFFSVLSIITSFVITLPNI